MNLSDEARNFLDQHRVGHLATVDAAGAPHVIPLCYARVDDTLYFVADDKPKRSGPTRLKRLSNIHYSPRVALVVDDYDENWSRLAFLLLHLGARVVDAPAEYSRALEALRQRYPQYRDMPLAPASHPMVRMTPVREHFWRAIDSAPVRSAAQRPSSDGHRRSK